MTDKAITSLVEIDNITEARECLKNLNNHIITLSNKPGSIYYLGIKVIDYMFKILQQEFVINSLVINTEDCQMSVLSAIKLNYRHIKYTGHSQEIHKILSSL